MPKCILTLGISSSGKTTWAEQQGLPIVCRDDYRRAAVGVGEKDNLWRYYDFKKHEKSVDEACKALIHFHVMAKIDFIIADTNLNPKYREPLVQALKNSGYDVEIKEFSISFEEAVKRDLKRRDTVGKDVIYKQWQQWIQYLNDTGQKRMPSWNSNKQAIICDIDGTIAHMDNRRGPYDWDKVISDRPDLTVLKAIRAFSFDHKILFVSGRDAVCRDMTVRWLAEYDIDYDKLLMRPEGDTRKDNIVKEEIFWEHIAPHYNVVAVFDDRPQVIRMWLDLGLKVFSVGNPYIEF